MSVAAVVRRSRQQEAWRRPRGDSLKAGTLVADAGTAGGHQVELVRQREDRVTADLKTDVRRVNHIQKYLILVGCHM